MKCPNTENLSENVWSIRTSSSFPLVGWFAPPWKAQPLVGFGKIPAANSEDAFVLTKHEGITVIWVPAVGAAPVQPPAVNRAPILVGHTASMGFPFAAVAGSVTFPLASG